MPVEPAINTFSDTEAAPVRKFRVPKVTVVDAEESQSSEQSDGKASATDRTKGLRRYSDSFSELTNPNINSYFPSIDARARPSLADDPSALRRSRRPVRRRGMRQEDSVTSAASLLRLDSSSTNFNFIDWKGFQEDSLPKRKAVGKHGHEAVVDALDGFEVAIEKVGLKGLGKFAKPIIDTFHVHFPLNDFQLSQDRTLLRPDSTSRKLTQRELERVEGLLFDTSKFDGNGNHITVLAWDKENNVGGITLFEVTVAPPRRGRKEEALRIHPIAAMEDVPKPVLVNMRVNHGIRKIVFERSNNKFKWNAQVCSAPSYTKVREREARSPRRGRSLRVDRYEDPRLADAHGILATIPQFMGLLHSNMAVLETFRSTEPDEVETEEGEFVRRVTLMKGPRGRLINGRDVHVVVLMPNEAYWAEERIFWTDEDQLSDLRQRKYWDLVERGRSRSRSPTGSDRSRRSRRSES